MGGGGGGQGAMARHGTVRPTHPQTAVPGPVIWSKAEDDLLLAITHEFGVNWTMVRGRCGRGSSLCTIGLQGTRRFGRCAKCMALQWCVAAMLVCGGLGPTLRACTRPLKLASPAAHSAAHSAARSAAHLAVSAAFPPTGLRGAEPEPQHAGHLPAAAPVQAALPPNHGAATVVAGWLGWWTVMRGVLSASCALAEVAAGLSAHLLESTCVAMNLPSADL